MSLLDESMELCVFLEKTRVSDGAGGFVTSYKEGADFFAAINFNSSIEAKIGAKQGVTSLYTVTTRKNTMLEFHDVFKRISDGKILRVTTDGDDIKTPGRATFQIRQVSAEEWTPA